jgi:hypothetical protein
MPELETLGTVTRYSKSSLTRSLDCGAARPSLYVTESPTALAMLCPARKAWVSCAARCDIRCYVRNALTPSLVLNLKRVHSKFIHSLLKDARIT